MFNKFNSYQDIETCSARRSLRLIFLTWLIGWLGLSIWARHDLGAVGEAVRTEALKIMAG